ncbi:DUF3105 domain-containing protein [Microbacterium sediminis]|uniref:Uncharacterized protein n=1 Tax=Microbacterium sediminis TaxID=904291 RepID=A0A1B9N7Y0_9MICO|nr:DUF3105 domain-containing protein [Microbacterium sediminis]OCG72693.1 hypothetical protein A7J15_10680 [Microbacterium sediminis]QBR74794.1 DUF3105 domain-containing protein [Microbacterium sediminis]
MAKNGKGTSGNPARAAEQQLTVKQQREANRQAKLAEYQAQLKKRQRGKLVWWAVGSAAVLAVVAAIVVSYVFAPQYAEYTAGGDGSAIEGVETFENDTTHVEIGTEVDYAQTPSAGGEHYPYWLNCGIYTEPQEDEYATHSMEHGAVWLTYDPAQVSDDDIARLEAITPRTYAILSPYEGMDSPISIQAWNAQLKVDSADDPRLGEFFEEYWRSENVPEPGSACSGAYDGPGKA